MMHQSHHQHQHNYQHQHQHQPQPHYPQPQVMTPQPQPLAPPQQLPFQPQPMMSPPQQPMMPPQQHGGYGQQPPMPHQQHQHNFQHHQQQPTPQPQPQLQHQHQHHQQPQALPQPIFADVIHKQMLAATVQPLDPQVLNFFDDSVRTAHPKEIHSTVVAVDAAYLLDRLRVGFEPPLSKLHNIRRRGMQDEPLLTVMGGAPASLRSTLDEALQIFNHASIRPIMVFPGVPPKLEEGVGVGMYNVLRNDLSFISAQARDRAWSSVENDGTGDAAAAFFELPDASIMTEGHLNYAMGVMKELGVECIRAPYSSLAQVAYLAKVKAVHHIFASPEVLLYEAATRVIVEIEMNKYHYLDRADIYSNFTGRNQQDPYGHFLNTILLASQFPNPPATKNGTNNNSNGMASGVGGDAVQDASALIIQYKGAVTGAIAARTPNNPVECQTKTKRFLRTATQYRHGLILNLDCDCVPISQPEPGLPPPSKDLKIPCNLHDIWGDRATNMLYFLHSIGALSTSLLTDLVHNCYREHAPLVDTCEYREMLEKIVPLRTQVIFQLINTINPDQDSHFQMRSRMLWHRWFHSRETTVMWPPQISLGEWNVYNHKDHVDFNVIYKYVECSAKEFPPDAKYRCVNDVVIVVIMKALDLLGYFTHSTLQTMEETSGLSVYSEALQKLSPQHQEAGVLLIELLRTKSLRGSSFTLPQMTPNQPVTQVMWPCRNLTDTLIARVWCLVPLHLDNPWVFGASRDLSAFVTMAQALVKTLRSLSEVLCANLFISGKVAIDPASSPDLPFLGKMLPFNTEPSAHMGIVMAHILNEDEAELSMANLLQQYPCCKSSLERDLQEGFKFWNEVNSLLSELATPEKDTENPTGFEDIYMQFSAADFVVQRKYQVLFNNVE